MVKSYMRGGLAEDPGLFPATTGDPQTFVATGNQVPSYGPHGYQTHTLSIHILTGKHSHT